MSINREEGEFLRIKVMVQERSARVWWFIVLPWFRQFKAKQAMCVLSVP
jgi:hypothetical protein